MCVCVCVITMKYGREYASSLCMNQNYLLADCDFIDARTISRSTEFLKSTLHDYCSTHSYTTLFVYTMFDMGMGMGMGIGMGMEKDMEMEMEMEMRMVISSHHCVVPFIFNETVSVARHD